MEHNRPKWASLFAVCAGLCAVLLSVYCLELKRAALQFHTRNYNYFIEQAARLTDPGLKNAFALNIEGYNMLGLQGIEGVNNLYQAIHAEYFRYTYVILYGLFRNTLPVYLFYSLVFFAPLGYYALIRRGSSKDSWKAIVQFTLLYLLFPATLPAVTADLRPRILFASAWCLAVLAVFYQRPFWEKLIFFCLLLGIREEGVFLGACVIGLNFLRMAGKPGRWKQTTLLLALDAAALGAFLAFMAWGGYTRVDRVYDPRNFIANLFSNSLLLSLGALALAALLGGFWWLKMRGQSNLGGFILVYLAATALTSTQVVRDTQLWYRAQNQIGPVNPGQVFLHFVTQPTSALAFYTVILLLVLVWDSLQGQGRKMLGGLLAILGIIFAASTLLTAPQQISLWQQKLTPARLVWAFVESHDRYQTNVLVDYDTYQAFYNFDRVIVYNRLPVWYARSEKRYYPENKPAVARLIQQRLEYAVISRGSLVNVLELAQMAGVKAQVLQANDSYVVLEFVRSSAMSPVLADF